MKLQIERRRLHHVGIKSRLVLSMERVTRSLGRTTENNEFQRVLDTARASPGLSANLDGQGTSLLFGRRGVAA